MKANISNKAIEGKDDFLFLGGSDSNDLLPHIMGERILSGAAIRTHMLNCAEWRSLNIPKVILIVPEAHVVYPDKLPDGVKVAPIRPVHNVLGIYGEDAIYPLDFFNDLRKTSTVVYSGNDSHWTEMAAFQTYETIRFRLNKLGVFVSKYTPSIDREVQDLRIVDKKVAYERERKSRELPAEAGSSIFETGILNYGNLSVFINKSKSARGRCLIFGTSFSNRLVPAVTQDFAEVVFCYGTAIDPFIVDVIKPDALILEMPERFLHYPSMSVPGGVFVGAHVATRGINFNFKNENLEYISRDLELFIKMISVLSFKSSSERDVYSVVDLIRLINDEAANRVSSVYQLLKSNIDCVLLRQFVCGQFRRDDLLSWVFSQIDSDPLRFDLPNVFPNSDMGILARVRVMAKSSKWIEAYNELNKLRTFSSDSKEFVFYDEYIREKMAIS